jgi:membrane protein YdbS with pleckstrin-like domain
MPRNPGQHVDPAAIAVWRWQHMITVAFLLAPIGVMSASAPRGGAALGAILAIAAAAAAWWWPRARYNHLTYDVDEQGLTIRGGVWWRDQSSLPRARIQHSDVSQGPLQRRYGIATLTFYTAGSRYTRISLDGLRHEEAIALRDALLSREHSGV